MQQRQPGGAIGGMLQGARQCAQVAHHGAFAQRFELDAAHRDACALQRRGDRRRVPARRNQHGHRGICLALARCAHDLHDARGLQLRVVAAEGMQADKTVPIGDGAERRQVADGRQTRIISHRKDCRAVLVHPGDEFWRRTKVAP